MVTLWWHYGDIMVTLWWYFGDTTDQGSQDGSDPGSSRVKPDGRVAQRRRKQLGGEHVEGGEGGGGCHLAQEGEEEPGVEELAGEEAGRYTTDSLRTKK